MLDATPLLKLYARYRLGQLSRMEPHQAQERQLLSLVQRAKGTVFGRRHNFSSVSSVETYQKQVPLRRYEDFWRDYWHKSFPYLADVTWPGTIRYFAKSSGTTSGNTKFIPVSREMMRSNRRAVFDLLSFHCQNHPETKLLGGKNFMLGGSTQLEMIMPGIYSGDLSGIAATEVPWWAKSRYYPPSNLGSIPDWNKKIDRLAPMSLQTDIRVIGGTASWLLAFLEKTIDLKPGASRIADIYPDMELMVHGGVNFSPYKTRFNQLLEASHAETREVYPASEGFMAAADRESGEGLRLILDNGLFFEFVPLEELDSDNPTRHWIQTVDTNQNYAIILTTCAGLWSYIVGDTVRFVDKTTPRILVTGRTSYSLSAFGEHLIGEEIENAITAASSALNLHVNDYAVGALHPEVVHEKGRHLYIVEFSNSPKSLEEFGEILDQHLKVANLDYAEHRMNDVQMLAPLIKSVPAGTFAAWMKSRGKLGGQNKVPRVINDPDLFMSLKDWQ